MKAQNLDAMSVDELMELRDRVTALLADRVVNERRALESRLARLKRVALLQPLGKDRVDRRSQVAPKFRNPDDPSETWSGRGRQPRWMIAALKAGRKMAELRIPDNAQARVRRPKRKKAR